MFLTLSQANAPIYLINIASSLFLPHLYLQQGGYVCSVLLILKFYETKHLLQKCPILKRAASAAWVPIVVSKLSNRKGPAQREALFPHRWWASKNC